MNKNSLQFDLNRLDEIVTKIVNNCNNGSTLYYCLDKMQEVIVNNCLSRKEKFEEKEQEKFLLLCKYFKEVFENENSNTW